jgi:hypothetical protein
MAKGTAEYPEPVPPQPCQQESPIHPVIKQCLPCYEPLPAPPRWLLLALCLIELQPQPYRIWALLQTRENNQVDINLQPTFETSAQGGLQNLLASPPAFEFQLKHRYDNAQNAIRSSCKVDCSRFQNYSEVLSTNILPSQPFSFAIRGSQPA